MIKPPPFFWCTSTSYRFPTRALGPCFLDSLLFISEVNNFVNTYTTPECNVTLGEFLQYKLLTSWGFLVELISTNQNEKTPEHYLQTNPKLTTITVVGHEKLPAT